MAGHSRVPDGAGAQRVLRDPARRTLISQALHVAHGSACTGASSPVQAATTSRPDLRDRSGQAK
jgi:hypothetical protein